MKKILFAALAAATALGASAEAPLWLRDARISPDGKTIVFTYKGDIFTVPSAGGKAVRLTSQESYEQMPVWSPDSKTIAFASDRYGNFDIFTVAADGAGQWKRLTFNSSNELPEAFTPDGKAVLFSAAIQDPASSALFPTGRMTEVYSVGTDASAPRQLLATPAQAISWAADGKSFLYQDVKGFEDTWRKHHRSSVTRNIWRYDLATGHHTELIDVPGENLNPIDAGDEIYFLSERGKDKSINVYRAPKTDPSKAERVTGFNRHPVRFLSRAADGTLAFTYDGELYTMRPGGKPSKVNVELNADFPDEVRKMSSGRGASWVSASPNGKNIALIYRGDVYVTPVEYRTTKQISRTPQAEGHVVWANDSVLYYDSQREGKSNIYSATLGHASDPDLAHATLIEEKAEFKADGHERAVPQVSPDGKLLAFILDRNILAVKDLKSGKVRQLTDGSTYRHRNGYFTYRWSPDSKWIALEIVDRRHDPYTDVALIEVESGKLTNLTNSGYTDGEPKWIMNGNAIAFASERLGMRNHASWGSENDVFFIFLNDKAYRKYTMSKEDRSLDKTPADTSKIINVELDGIEHRTVRVTPMSTDLIDFAVDADGKTLYYTSEGDDGSFIWEYDLEEQELNLKKQNSQGAGFEQTPDGKTIFLVGSSISTFGSSSKPVTYNAEMTLDPAAEREFMFDYVEREARERFYTADMNGVDWAGLSKDYRKFLPHINNNYDFAELLSEWLGELNVSHTGGRYFGGSGAQAPTSTSSLGVLLDMGYTGKGARVAEVLEHGPLYGLTPAVKAGDIITAVDGTEVDTANPLDRLLIDRAGKRTLVAVKDADGKTNEYVVKPISRGRESGMLYRRWVEARAAEVDSLSHGRLGYVHISSMDDDSFRKAYSDLLGKYNDREGVVIDIRWNGGGRLHEDIEVLLSGEKYFTQEIRGNATCDMPSRRWNKPSIMVMAEPCYSNAHGTPWVYSHRKLGKLVGMPVPGTMSSVNWITMQDPSMVFGVPVIAYRLPDGSVLENTQLEPDIRVANSPEDIVRGIDMQIRTAVEELLIQIDKK